MAENKKLSEKLRLEREGAENVLHPAGKEKGTENLTKLSEEVQHDDY